MIARALGDSMGTKGVTILLHYGRMKVNSQPAYLSHNHYSRLRYDIHK
jgi:hypothetical protein